MPVGLSEKLIKMYQSYFQINVLALCMIDIDGLENNLKNAKKTKNEVNLKNKNNPKSGGNL